MAIPRIFINEELILGKEIKLTDKKFHYLINVMRCSVGDSVFCVNGKDGEFLSSICVANNRYCTLRITEKTRNYQKQNFLGLMFAPIQKLDTLIKSAVELGVTDFVPIKTRYAQNVKIDKIQYSAIEAIEQCERLDFPNFHKICDLNFALRNLEKDSTIFFCEERSQNTKIRYQDIDRTQKIYALVGPEGGFSDDEKTLIKSFKHVVPISLGNNILRSETAAIAILSLLS